MGGGEQPAVFASYKGLVKLEQGGRTYDDRVLGHACRCYEETGEAEQKPIPSCEVGGSSTAAVENDELMFDPQRLREQSPAATRADKLGHVDEPMDEKEESGRIVGSPGRFFRVYHSSKCTRIPVLLGIRHPQVTG